MALRCHMFEILHDTQRLLVLHVAERSEELGRALRAIDPRVERMHALMAWNVHAKHSDAVRARLASLDMEPCPHCQPTGACDAIRQVLVERAKQAETGWIRRAYENARDTGGRWNSKGRSGYATPPPYQYQQQASGEARPKTVSFASLKEAAGVLGLDWPCTRAELRKAFMQKIMLVHPDVSQAGNSTDAAGEARATKETQRLLGARELLERKLAA